MPKSKDWHGGIAFIDRDGVLNKDIGGHVNSTEEFFLHEGSAESVASLRRAGWKTCLVTNQSAIGRGWWDEENLEGIHQYMLKEMAIIDSDAVFDSIQYCPHPSWEGCGCRKPMPGMLFAGMKEIRAETMLPSSWDSPKPKPKHPLDSMIGDRRGDMGAGWQIGARLFRVDSKLGIASVIDRVIDRDDSGDRFNP